MSYTKQTWNTGDTITADKLNHMEDGIGGGYDIVFDLTASDPIADGASFEELFSGGEKKAANVNSFGNSKRYTSSFSFQTSSYSEENVVMFYFMGAEEEAGKLYANCIALSSTNEFRRLQINPSGAPKVTMSGSYTYSNGHYTFIPDGD